MDPPFQCVMFVENLLRRRECFDLILEGVLMMLLFSSRGEKPCCAALWLARRNLFVGRDPGLWGSGGLAWWDEKRTHLTPEQGVVQCRGSGVDEILRCLAGSDVAFVEVPGNVYAWHGGCELQFVHWVAEKVGWIAEEQSSTPP